MRFIKYKPWVFDFNEKNILYKLPGGGRSTGYDLVKEKDEKTPAGNKS